MIVGYRSRIVLWMQKRGKGTRGLVFLYKNRLSLSLEGIRREVVGKIGTTKNDF